MVVPVLSLYHRVVGLLGLSSILHELGSRRRSPLLFQSILHIPGRNPLSVIAMLFSAVARSRAAAVVVRGVQTRRLASSGSEAANNRYSYIDNPISGSVILVGLTAAVGAVMYYTDDPLPSTPEEAVWQKSRQEQEQQRP